MLKQNIISISFTSRNFAIKIGKSNIIANFVFNFVGNKNDRTNSREVPLHIGDNFAQRHDMRFLETSAKEADNVEKLFLEIAKELTQQARENELKPSYADSMELGPGDSSPIGTFGSCCKYM